ncbi:hypothetical protein ACIF6L_31855 [Kitasatospora sp. NPDC086009]|uniref:hypothetical protein n=1 Tax=unclassified Kitasatospora TaxID=2633591 RepID=UPI0037C677E7
MACAAAGVGALIALAAPQAQAVPVSGPVSAVAAELPAGAVPGHWTIDRKAPVVKVPDAGRVTLPQESQSTTTDDPYTQVRNARYSGQVCGLDRVDMVTGPGPMTLTLSQSRAVASTWSASVSVAAWKVSGTVGFSVTDTATNTESGAFPVPAGKFGYLEAYPLYDLYSYDIYNVAIGDRYVGGGTAQHPVGYCYNAYTD